MKKNGGLLKSLSVCLVVAVLMVGAGFFLLAGESAATHTGGKVEAAWDGHSLKENEAAVEEKEEKEEKDIEKEEFNEASGQEEEVVEEVQDDVDQTDIQAGNGAADSGKQEEPAPSIVQNTASAPVDHRAKQQESSESQEESQPAETATEEPAAVPAPVVEEPVAEIPEIITIGEEPAVALPDTGANNLAIRTFGFLVLAAGITLHLLDRRRITE